MRDKIFILGGRSGTSLVHKCLLRCNLKNWGDKGEPKDVKTNVINTYPNTTFKWATDFEIAKCPQFDLVLGDVIEKYHPKFLILERGFKDSGDSSIRLGWDKILFPKFKANKWIYKNLGNPEDSKTAIYSWFKLHKRFREKFLENYDKSKILRIKFNDLMSNFEDTMNDIANFCEVKPLINMWNEMRKKKLVATKTDVTKYIE